MKYIQIVKRYNKKAWKIHSSKGTDIDTYTSDIHSYSLQAKKMLRTASPSATPLDYPSKKY